MDLLQLIVPGPRPKNVTASPWSHISSSGKHVLCGSTCLGTSPQWGSPVHPASAPPHQGTPGVRPSLRPRTQPRHLLVTKQQVVAHSALHVSKTSSCTGPLCSNQMWCVTSRWQHGYIYLPGVTLEPARLAPLQGGLSGALPGMTRLMLRLPL